MEKRPPTGTSSEAKQTVGGDTSSMEWPATSDGASSITSPLSSTSSTRSSMITLWIPSPGKR